MFTDEEFSHSFEAFGAVIEKPEKLLLAHWLARNGISSGLRILALEGMLSDAVDEGGCDLLFWAARGGDEASLIIGGEFCDTKRKDIWGATALHHWAESTNSGSGAGAQILLAMGSDPIAVDFWGMMPMHWCSEQNVWSWSMAALWASGRTEAWTTCNGVPCDEAMARVGHGGLSSWARRSGWENHRTERFCLRRDSPASESELAKVKLLNHDLATRREMLNKAVFSQNCLANRLGLKWSDASSKNNAYIPYAEQC